MPQAKETHANPLIRTRDSLLLNQPLHTRNYLPKFLELLKLEEIAHEEHLKDRLVSVVYLRWAHKKARALNHASRQRDLFIACISKYIIPII